MELTATNNTLSVPKGYKQTDVGVIPEDWEVHTIEKLCNVMGRVGWKGYTKKDLVEFGPYTIGAKHINKNNRLDLSEPTCLSLEKYLESPEIFVFKDDLLIVQRGTIGKLVLIGSDIGKATINPSMLIIRSKTNISGYIYYYLLSEEGQSQILNDTSSTGVPMITQKQVKSFKIPLPPTLTEQKAIAQVLSDTDALLQALEKKIAKKKRIKKGVMQELLKPKEGWVVKTIREVANYRRGSFPQPYGLPEWYDNISGMPFVQVVDVDKNFKLKKETKQKISSAGAEMSVFVKKGTIILTLQGSIGRICITDYDAYVDRTLLIFESLKENFDKYFFMLSIWLKFQIEKQNAPGGIIKTITKEALSSFEIAYPKKEEQTQIAKILSDMDSEIQTLEQKLYKYQLAKQGMMQQLLTGKIRLVV